MPRDRRNQNTTSLKQAMNQLLDSYRLDQKFAETELVSAWSRIMGAPIANRTDQIYIHNRTLFVKLNSAPLKHELTLSKGKVLELIEREFGKKVVDDVVFR